jgi:hypothetical protein
MTFTPGSAKSYVFEAQLSAEQIAERAVFTECGVPNFGELEPGRRVAAAGCWTPPGGVRPRGGQALSARAAGYLTTFM